PKGYVMRKVLNTKLEVAFEALDEEQVKSLLAAGADKSRHLRNEWLLSSCHCSETPENIEYVKILLNNGANPNWIDPDPSWYETPLMESLYYFNFNIAQLLIDNGAKVNMHSSGDTPLTWFAGRTDDGHLTTIKFLHKNGANLNVKNHNGETALMKVAGFDTILSADLFRKKPDWLIEPIKYLLSKGAKVNLRDKKGKTALLHSLGQNWGSYYSWNNETALQYKDNFSETFYYEIPTILLSNGARISIADKNGKDAMDYATADEEKMDLFARAIDDSNKFLRRKIVVMSK
ncbi:MAG: ankyrin repeat domain-containing protein, partial [Alphaproteobacteria bacterium]|nr:ankyrin repeat domain-containing protein [Alphaproteobacteria bacterium]